MNKIKIITDGCSDLPSEWKREYDIDVVPLTVLWDGEEKPVTTDWESYTPKEFYDAVRAGSKIRSNQAQREEFAGRYEKYLGEGYDIIYVGCSSALSGTYSVGAVVAAEMDQDNGKIYCIDAHAATGGEALVVREAARLAASGLCAEDVVKKVQELSRHIFQVGSVDTLEYLKRSGRVKATAAFFGNLFGIKPIIVNDAEGANVSIKKVKGRQNAISTSVAMLKDVMCYDGQTYPVSEQTVYIGHADCADTAEYLAELIKKEINPKDVVINYIGPAVGASVGPTMFGLYAFGKTAEERKFN